MDVGRLARTHVTTGDLTPPSELVQSLNAGQLPLSEVVKALGEYLISTEDDTRLKGLTFLANIVKAIDSSRINRPATQTLTSFFSAKLDDFDSLPIALEALTVLSKLRTFDDAAAVDLYRGLVEQVNVKSYVQATRHLAYVLVDSLLALHRKAFTDLGAEFLNSYTKFVDGEKDPRNLMLLFSMDKVILLEFDIEGHIDDLFDVTFCYFPITFKPPPNDPYGITAEDLKLALRSCMSATPLFAKQAIPLFLEKFSTAAGPAMKDLLQSLSACLPVYGAAAVQDRGTELWEGIKTEIMYSSDVSIEASALSALEALIKTLYPGDQDTSSGLAQDIVKQSVEMMKDPEKNQAISATKTLAALLRASGSIGQFAYAQAMPPLLRQFNSSSSPSHRAAVLAAISSLVTAAQSVSSLDSSHAQHAIRSLSPFRDGVIDALREGLRTDDLKSAAINGTVSLLQIADFVTRKDMEDLVRAIDDIILNDDDPEHRSNAVEGLMGVASTAASIIEDITLPALVHNLPEFAPDVGDITSRERYRSILGSLTKICVQPDLFEIFVVRILTKLELLAGSVENDSGITTPANRSPAWMECQVAYAWELLHALETAVANKIRQQHTDLVKQFDRVVPRLNDLVVYAATTGTQGDKLLFRHEKLVSIVADVSGALFWQLDAARQSDYWRRLDHAFAGGDFSAILHDSSAGKSASGSPFRNAAPIQESNLLALYSIIVQALKPTTDDPFPSAVKFLTDKLRWTVHCSANEFQLQAALNLITAYTNKRDTQLADSLVEILEVHWNQDVINTEVSRNVRQKGLWAYIHCIKGLTLLRHPLAYTAINRVIDILSLSTSDAEFVNAAAQGFSIVAQSKGKGSSQKSRLITKLLYAQKMWNHVLPQLISGDSEASGRERLPYLIAFASLLPLAPASLCLSSLPLILPLLLRSLSLPDPAQRTHVLIALISILETQNLSTEVDTLLHQNATRLVESISKSYIPDTSLGMRTDPRVRSFALRALGLIPDAIRFDTLRSSKSIVLKELGSALDDPARSVRREAVECRARWYKYGS